MTPAEHLTAAMREVARARAAIGRAQIHLAAANIRGDAALAEHHARVVDGFWWRLDSRRSRPEAFRVPPPATPAASSGSRRNVVRRGGRR